MIGDGGYAFAELTLRSMPAGRAVPTATIYEVRAGEIVAARLYYDSAAFDGRPGNLESTMILPQGDLALLDTELAKDLLNSRVPARLAYSWTDGSPRVVPIYFSWTGEELVVGSPPTSPKVKALAADPRVAVTIDTEGFPARVLMLRGAASIQVQDGVVSEYADASRRYMGEDAGKRWVEDLEGRPGIRMARIALRPEWVALIDFETRLPSALGGVIA